MDLLSRFLGSFWPTRLSVRHSDLHIKPVSIESREDRLQFYRSKSSGLHEVIITALQRPQLLCCVRPCFAVPNISNRSGSNSVSKCHRNIFASKPLVGVTRLKAHIEIVHNRYFQLVNLQDLRFAKHGLCWLCSARMLYVLLFLRKYVRTTQRYVLPGKVRRLRGFKTSQYVHKSVFILLM